MSSSPAALVWPRQNVTRDRYNLAAQAQEKVQLKPVVPHVSPPLVPAGMESFGKRNEASGASEAEKSLAEMQLKTEVVNPFLVPGNRLVFHRRSL